MPPLNAIPSFGVGNKADLLTPLCLLHNLSALQGIQIDKMQKRKCWLWVVRNWLGGRGLFRGYQQADGRRKYLLNEIVCAREFLCE